MALEVKNPLANVGDIRDRHGNTCRYSFLDNPMGFPHTSVSKESACNAGYPGSIPGSGRSFGEGIGYPLQYSVLENSMDCIVRGVTKSWT